MSVTPVNKWILNETTKCHWVVSFKIHLLITCCSSSSSCAPISEHSRLHKLTPLWTILRTHPFHAVLRPRLWGRRSSSIVRSHVRLGRPAQRRQSAGGRLMAARRMREWSTRCWQTYNNSYVRYLRHKIPQTSNLQLGYSSMMSKTAVQKRPFQFEGLRRPLGGGGLGPQAYLRPCCACTFLA